jgi:rfaE bifunctional protein nucleotidyltransferase chain/domain
MKPKEMLKGRYIDNSDLSEFGKKVHQMEKKIVFTSGNWDLLHIGQMRYLAEAKKQGDILVVGVNSNESVRKTKGAGKPVLDEWVRAESLLFLKSVDYVTIIPTPSCKTVIEVLKPDVMIAVGEDWNKDLKSSKEYKALTENGGEVKVIERQSPFVSTTKIMKKIVGATIRKDFKKYLDEGGDLKPIKERFLKSDEE